MLDRRFIFEVEPLCLISLLLSKLNSDMKFVLEYVREVLAFHIGKALINSSTFFPVSKHRQHLAFEIVDLVSISMEISPEMQKLLGRKDGLKTGICQQNDHECPISLAKWSGSCLTFKDSLFFVETYLGEMLIFFFTTRSCQDVTTIDSNVEAHLRIH